MQKQLLLVLMLFLVMVSAVSAQDEPVTLDLLIDDFESGIPHIADRDGTAIGFVPWGSETGNVVLVAQAVESGSEEALPFAEEAPNTVLALNYDIDSWGGFTHAFADAAVWTSMDWTAYTAFSFWLYGSGTGGTIQIDLFDNRNPDQAGDTAERYFYRIDDDFAGWRQFTIPFELFQRRTDFQPAGAPNDGLGLDQVSGYAFGLPAGMGAQTVLLDQVGLANIGGAEVILWGGDPVIIPEATPVNLEEETVSEPREWNLVWSDEFDGAAGTPVDATKWTAEIGGQGWGNNEWEYYTDRTENAALDGEGSLAIVAREETLPNTTCHYGECRFTSARLITWHKFEFTYGRVEARIRLPFGQGIWPAFWMLGTDIGSVGWPDSGEIDIMEYIGREPRTIYGTVHGPGYSGANGVGGSTASSTPFADDWHVFAIEWVEDEIRWYVDGNLYHIVTPSRLRGNHWVYDHDFFILLNLAVGGNWPGYPDETTQFPQTMLVDYVRVYQRAGE